MKKIIVIIFALIILLPSISQANVLETLQADFLRLQIEKMEEMKKDKKEYRPMLKSNFEKIISWAVEDSASNPMKKIWPSVGSVIVAEYKQSGKPKNFLSDKQKAYVAIVIKQFDDEIANFADKLELTIWAYLWYYQELLDEN